AEVGAASAEARAAGVAEMEAPVKTANTGSTCSIGRPEGAVAEAETPTSHSTQPETKSFHETADGQGASADTAGNRVQDIPNRKAGSTTVDEVGGDPQSRSQRVSDGGDAGRTVTSEASGAAGAPRRQFNIDRAEALDPELRRPGELSESVVAPPRRPRFRSEQAEALNPELRGEVSEPTKFRRQESGFGQAESPSGGGAGVFDEVTKPNPIQRAQPLRGDFAEVPTDPNFRPGETGAKRPVARPNEPLPSEPRALPSANDPFARPEYARLPGTEPLPSESRALPSEGDPFARPDYARLDQPVQPPVRNNPGPVELPRIQETQPIPLENRTTLN